MSNVLLDSKYITMPFLVNIVQPEYIIVVIVVVVVLQKKKTTVLSASPVNIIHRKIG